MSKNTAPLLIEIGCEELPAGPVEDMSLFIARGVVEALTAENLIDNSASLNYFCTPRRLACHITNVAMMSEAKTNLRLGPSTSAAFDSEGEASPAAKGFARSVGVDIKDLKRIDTPKGERLAYEITEPGQSLTDVLQETLPRVIKSMPLPKTMRWGDGDDRFLRPVHWLVTLHGSTVLPLQLMDIVADRITLGHRTHSKNAISLEHADHYVQNLQSHNVFAQRHDRIEKIERDLEKHSTSKGLKWENDLLLYEVADLTEWPVGILCSFDQTFLEVPKEVLEISMKSHQKFFPLRHPDDTLSPYFVAFANLESSDEDEVRTGFERVIRPRLADAKFFWDQDLKTRLEDYFPRLEKVTFQQELGTLADKARRTQQLSVRIAEKLDLDSSHVERAAKLSLCDLTTDMVGEFPELQGVIGRYYAASAGEDDNVAKAIEQQYWPIGTDGQTATAPTGQILAIAERIDRLLGIFAAGKRPSGNKDPFGLRRAAIGLIRTILDAKLTLPLNWLLEQSADCLAEKKIAADESLRDEVQNYILDRLQSVLTEVGGNSPYPKIDVQSFRAVRAIGITDIADFAQRASAVQNFLVLKTHVNSLAQANKRSRNLLRKADLEGTISVNPELFQIDAESQLFDAISEKSQQVSEKVNQKYYGQALDILATLQQPLDTFFDEVMVMCDDVALRNNRLALLADLQGLCRQVAAFDELAV